MNAIERLGSLLPFLVRPPGGGIPIISTGTGVSDLLQKKHFGIFYTNSISNLNQVKINELWRESWKQLARARTAVLGVPLDTGAGIRRGAAYGPIGVRNKLLDLPSYRDALRSGEIVDLGDILINPHLLHDEMLNQPQIEACRASMYSDAPDELRSTLPVAALSVTKTVLDALLDAYPSLRVTVLGGDHSVAWPVTQAFARKYNPTLAIVQPDAHTDLLPSRFGVKYCFGTWSYHANDLLGRRGKLIQVGIRQSGRDRAHWESVMGVRQYWAHEVRERPPADILDEIVAHFKARGIRQIYFSNDIDGTDESEASATGTPAAEGLSSGFLLALIQRLGAEFELVAADVMEVAPDLGDAAESEATCSLAAKYVMECLKSQIKPAT